MRPTDTLPKLDPTMPEVQTAITRIKMQVQHVEREFPDWTSQQVLREARRRCAAQMVAVAEQQEARRYGLRLRG